MKKFTTLFKVKYLAAIVLLVAGSMVFLAMTNKGQPESNTSTKLNMAPGGDDDEPLSSNCGGVERWAVKVMTDASWTNFDSVPKPATVTHLVNITTPTPNSNMPRYDAVEDSCYSTICTIKQMRVESDSDYHLVITDGISTMIAECPSPSCNSVIASHYNGDFIKARTWIQQNIGNLTNTYLNIQNVEIHGQAFIDPPHGQAGAAPNNLELHSIIYIGFHVNGINDPTEKSGVKIYPNPSDGKFTIDFKQTLKAHIAIFNMLGQQVYKGALNTGKNSIDISGSAAGTYIYHITDVTGDLVAQGKLTVE